MHMLQRGCTQEEADVQDHPGSTQEEAHVPKKKPTCKTTTVKTQKQALEARVETLRKDRAFEA